MQDPPELLSQMYKKIKEKNINIVYGKRIKSNEGFFKKFFSKIFYSVFLIFFQIQKFQVMYQILD